MIPQPTPQAMLDALALVEARRNRDEQGWRCIRRNAGQAGLVTALANLAAYLAESLDDACECGAEGQHALDVMRAYALDTS